MTRLDLSPLFRSSVGFDHLTSLLEGTTRLDQPAYPPYNIERMAEDKYRIAMAIAGFKDSDLSIESVGNSLSVTGTIDKGGKDDREYLYRGIAERNFERKFQLAEHVKVVGAKLENGLLNIDLVREIPETLKPRKIEIGTVSDKVIEGKASRADSKKASKSEAA